VFLFSLLNLQSFNFALTENYLIWFFLKSAYLLFGQADILARFKPEIDVSTLISSIRSAEESMRICLDNFSNTRHMVLYYEDVIRDQDVGITKQMFSASDSAVVTLTAHFFCLAVCRHCLGCRSFLEFQ
jgi:hypothetical protein